MKTRTLLLLSVGTALAILVAGGVLLFQLSSQDPAVAPTALGERATVGDVTVTVLDVRVAGDVLSVDIELGGIDDQDGLDSFRLVTGDQQLRPLAAPDDGRCAAITVTMQRCALEFDVGSAATSSRVLVMRRGDDQANWPLR